MRSARLRHQRLDQLTHVLGRAPVRSPGKFLHLQARKHFLYLRDERRRIQLPSGGILPGKGHGEALAGAGTGDVAEITLARDLIQYIGVQRGVPAVQFRAVGIRQDHRGDGRGREDRFIHPQQERKFQIRIARPVNRADQHFVQRRRNRPHGQAGQPGVEHGQPFRQRHALARKSQGHVIEP